jgi:ribonuclease HI
MKNKIIKVHTMYADGGAYNNGQVNQSARVCVVYENEVVIHENAGNHTNNEAEFLAIERAFEWIEANIPKEDVVTIFSDSKLAVNMVNYIWQGQIVRIKELRDRITAKMPENVLIKWIYRDYNKAGQYLEFNLPRV